MNAKRKFLFRAVTIAILLIIAVAMFFVGRGHTVYFDNKALEFNSQTYAAPYKVEVNVGDEQVAKLYDKERGKTICIGQKFTMTLAVTKEKGGGEETTTMTFSLPRNMDGIIFNLPALLAGLPEEAYLTEFISVPVETEEEEIITDDLGLPTEPTE